MDNAVIDRMVRHLRATSNDGAASMINSLSAVEKERQPINGVSLLSPANKDAGERK